MTTPLRVGMIGVSAHRGWAKEAHVPAVHAIDGLELAAVATNRQQSADQAAAALGVPVAYGDTSELFADPAIDLVTVAAPVPAHHDLVLAAVAAGKHVYCEWPLGASTAQTERIAAGAAQARVHTAIGLQARQNPVVTVAGELLAAGAVGRPLTVSVQSTTAGFGPVVAEPEFYLEDPDSGMSLRTIQMPHTIDLVTRLMGPLDAVAALTTVQYPDLQVGQPPRLESRVLPDHVLVQARLSDGGALSMEVAGGRPPQATPFRLDVTGDGGTLSLVGGAPRGFQSGTLSLFLDGEPHAVDAGETGGLAPSVVNVASVYAGLRDDIRHDTWTVPDFQHAQQLAHLSDVVIRAADTGRRISVTE